MKKQENYPSNYFNIANSLFFLNKEILENSSSLMKIDSFDKNIYKFIHEAEDLIRFHIIIMESLVKNNNIEKTILKTLIEEHNLSMFNFEKMIAIKNINFITN